MDIRETKNYHANKVLPFFVFCRILDPKPPEKSSPRLTKKASTAKSSKTVAIVLNSTSSEEDEEAESVEEEEAKVLSSRRKLSIANTPSRTPARQSKPTVAQKIAQRVQTPARSKAEAKKTPAASKNNSARKSSKLIANEFWSQREPQLTPSRTRPKPATPPKRQSTADEAELVDEVPLKKTRVSSRTPVQPKKPVQAAKNPSVSVKKAPARPASKKRPRHRQPSISPPPPKTNSRRTELEERVCETCQQVFYSGTELALHELRHTGKVLVIRLDKYEIPEPVQNLEQSYLFQDPVNLDGPARVADSSEDGQHEFSFESPKILDVIDGVLAEQEAQPYPPDIFNSANDNSNSATENAVESIIESLQDVLEENDKNKEEKAPTNENEKSPTKATALSFDFFPPSSPKESSKTSTTASLSLDFFGPPDPPGMKTPPPSTAALSFDFFDSVESSPSKDCSMFSPPSVDPSSALKPNSDNPSLPLPSDSDNSMTLTPPKDGSKFDKLEAAIREAVGDA